MDLSKLTRKGHEMVNLTRNFMEKFHSDDVATEIPLSEFLVNETNGFLPVKDPLYPLPEEYAVLESILNRMPVRKDDGQPGLLATGQLYDTVLSELPLYDVSNVTDSALATALFRDYTFLASAYLLEPCDIFYRKTGQYGCGRSILPKNIAVPLTVIAKKIGAKPFMEYAQSYALYNWKRKNAEKGIEYDNIQLIRKFTGMPSEKGFILVHVDMVRFTPLLVSGVVGSFSALENNDRPLFNEQMKRVLFSARDINLSMEQMWKRSKPADYLKYRTFIMGTKGQEEMFPKGVMYEGCTTEPTFYRGESGANDSIIPTLDNFLQLTEKMPKNEMTDILRDFRSYRPKTHEEWLEWVETNAKKKNLEHFCKQDRQSHMLYIQLLDQVREFRTRHWKFAKEYIIKRTAYPKATGGSPMATWLPNQLQVVLDNLKENCLELERQASIDGNMESREVARKILESLAESLL
jgi:indoleamine 2,3-dioxygenase